VISEQFVPGPFATIEFTRGDPFLICTGDTVQLVDEPNADFTYTWQPTTGLVFDGEFDTHNPGLMGIANTTYYVTVTDGLCTVTDSVTVEVLDGDNLAIVGDSITCDGSVELTASGGILEGEFIWATDPSFDNIIFTGETLVTTFDSQEQTYYAAFTICNDTVRLSVSGAIGNGDYEWASDAAFANIIATGAELETIIDGLAATYFVRYTDPTCGDEIFSYDVRLYQYDLVYTNEWVICPGDTIDFPMFNFGEQDLTFVWEDDAHIVNGSNNMLSPMIGTGVTETDTFTLFFTATSSFGCEFSDSVEVRFRENPSVNITSELQECGEFTVCFGIDGDYQGFPEWDFGDLTTDEDTSIDSIPCWTYAGPGVYEVILTNLVGICPFENDTLLVTVNDEITIDPIAEQIACLGDEVTLTATSPDNNVDLTWCNAAGDTLAVGPDVTVVADSSYQITVKGTDANGCSGEQVVDITIVEFDIVDNIGEVFCDGQETFIELTVNGTTDGYSFDWAPSDCIVGDDTVPNPTILASGAKTITVIITEDATGCMDTSSYDITVTSFMVTAAADPDTINPGESTDIFVQDQLDEYTYEWDNGNTDGEQTVSPEVSTTYTVTVTDELGCTAVTSVFVFVRTPVCDETDVYIPNAFTPNGDNVNDVLFVRSNFIDEMEMIVFNRWGEEVFKTSDPAAGWDGMYNGDELQPDVFAYYIDVLCINGVRYSKKGNVSLLK